VLRVDEIPDNMKKKYIKYGEIVHRDFEREYPWV
jgi:hypothetical protein